jgi:hypothetical protein
LNSSNREKRDQVHFWIRVAKRVKRLGVRFDTFAASSAMLELQQAHMIGGFMFGLFREGALSGNEWVECL